MPFPGHSPDPDPFPEKEELMRIHPAALPQPEEAVDFDQFLRDNRIRVNYSLNMVLWVCILAGPAIALGILGGAFKRTSYSACVIISAVMLVMAGGNLLILKKKPHDFIPGILALAGTDLLLGYMYVSHISLRLTFFLVPLLSLLFCNRKIYIGSCLFNYLVMGFSIWLEAFHYSELRTDFNTQMEGFINIFAGCTIEALVMFAAGFALGKAISSYYRRMINQYVKTQDDHAMMKEQLEILDSMAEIYDFVNLIDFGESTEMSLREETLHKIVIEKGQDHTHMVQGLREQIAPDMLDAFWQFTNITTVPDRLVNRRSIAGEFISTKTGWFRAQYIRVKGDMNRKPEMVIYTIQNINADKQKEEHLIHISLTDEMTGLFNRRCFEEDAAEIQTAGIGKDLALISADLNGLKTVNDNLGHIAGDELIKGAADCLLAAVGAAGKVYRVGGDEFMAIVRTGDCDALVRGILEKAAAWKGAMVDSISISVGCASHAENPGLSLEELEKLADKRMYDEKARHYSQSGMDRRRPR